MGWLSRWGGLSCDNLLAVEMVTADGTVVTASAEEHPDLFWAVRGGGGNFGVVTRFEFAAHELNPMANLGLFFWRPRGREGPLRRARDLIPDLPTSSVDSSPASVPHRHLSCHPSITERLVSPVALVNWGSSGARRAGGAVREMSPLFELVTPIPTSLSSRCLTGAPLGASSATRRRSISRP